MEFVLRPVAAIVLLGSACLIAALIKPLIPEGRLKQILYKKHPIVPAAEDRPRPRAE